MIYNNFSDLYKKVLINAEAVAKKNWYKELSEKDILLEILQEDTKLIKDLFNLYGIDKNLVVDLYSSKDLFPKNPTREWIYSWMSKSLKETILLSIKVAASFQKPVASIEDFLIALLEKNTWFPKILNYIWVDNLKFKKDLQDLNNAGTYDWESTLEKNSIWWEEMDQIFSALSQNLMNSMWGAWMKWTPFDANQKVEWKNDSKTPALDFFSTDLTREAFDKKLDKVIWREDEIQRLLSILNRKTKNNPVLVWEPWVWKTAIVEALALAISNWSVPFSMREKKILALDMSSLVAWTKFRWEFESRIKQIIEEASKVENEIILFIDEIHTIIGAWGSEWALDASNILKPAMWRWKIRVVGATTLNEYEKYIEKDPALERRFQRINVWEPSKNDAIEIISGLKEVFEDFHNLNITDDAVLAAVELSTRYITDRFLPDKAIDLIDEACSLKSMTYSWDEKKIQLLKEKEVDLNKKIEDAVNSQQYKKASKLKEKLKQVEQDIINQKKKFSIPKSKRMFIKEADIQNVLSLTTGIPVTDLSVNETDKLKKLEKNIKSRIIGQDNAISAITSSILRAKTGISNPNKPLGSFLFLWPTWVWKTQLVKILAEQFYLDSDSLIKIDMSEYSDKTWVSKLIWANAGYVGYEEWGILTKKVRKKPYSIVLFDEIEKWDFEVYNLLLQILDEWEVTDSKWKKINFRNTIIVMTSNIWQEQFNSQASRIWFEFDWLEKENLENDFEKTKDEIISNLDNYFSKEFLNRIENVIVFEPLDKKSIKKIVKLNLEELVSRLKNYKNIDLSYTPKVINHLTKTSFSPEFWAREVSRNIVNEVENLIAQHLLYHKKCDTLKLDIQKQKLILI